MTQCTRRSCTLVAKGAFVIWARWRRRGGGDDSGSLAVFVFFCVAARKSDR